jgi:hypothetical protein
MISYLDFFKEIESIFNSQKLINDLNNYLNITDDSVVVVTASHEFSGHEIPFEYHRSDLLGITSIVIGKKYMGLGYFPIKVEAVIGQFSINERTGIMNCENFMVDMLYHLNGELITVDFIYGRYGSGATLPN